MDKAVFSLKKKLNLQMKSSTSSENFDQRLCGTFENCRQV